MNHQPSTIGRITVFAKKLLAIAGTLSCALTVSAAHAQTPVAFIGGTTIHFTTLSGATINEWVMQVDAVSIP
jgi:hypothetical protein